MACKWKLSISVSVLHTSSISGLVPPFSGLHVTSGSAEMCNFWRSLQILSEDSGDSQVLKHTDYIIHSLL